MGEERGKLHVGQEDGGLIVYVGQERGYEVEIKCKMKNVQEERTGIYME